MSYFLYQKPPKYILYMTLTSEDKERIKQLRAKGLSYDKIRGETGFSRETIRKVLGLVKQKEESKGEGGTSSPAIAHVVDQPSEPYTPSPKKRDKLQEFIDSPYPSRQAFYYWQQWQWQWLQWQKRNEEQFERLEEEQFERLEREIKELKEEKRQEEWRRKIEIEREKKLKELHKKIMEYKAKYYSQRECGETK